MSSSTPDRRDFLAKLAATTAAVAATGLPRIAAAESTAVGQFDDGWTRRVKGAHHRAVFDSPEPNDGLALLQAWIWMRGYRDALGAKDGDAVPVVVLRHRSAPLAVDDALWAKHTMGALRKLDDPLTKQPAVRNPWARLAAGSSPDADTAKMLGGPADTTVEGVLKAGGVVLVCNLALRAIAASIAEKEKLDATAVHAELVAGLIPGVVPQPSGVYATARAQEVGCVFMRST